MYEEAEEPDFDNTIEIYDDQGRIILVDIDDPRAQEYLERQEEMLGDRH